MNFFPRSIPEGTISVSSIRGEIVQPNCRQRHAHLYPPEHPRKRLNLHSHFSSTKPAQFSYSRYGGDYLLVTVQESSLLSRFLAAFVNPRLRNQPSRSDLDPRTILPFHHPPVSRLSSPSLSFHSPAEAAAAITSSNFSDDQLFSKRVVHRFIFAFIFIIAHREILYFLSLRMSSPFIKVSSAVFESA